MVGNITLVGRSILRTLVIYALFGSVSPISAPILTQKSSITPSLMSVLVPILLEKLTYITPYHFLKPYSRTATHLHTPKAPETFRYTSNSFPNLIPLTICDTTIPPTLPPLNVVFSMIIYPFAHKAKWGEGWVGVPLLLLTLPAVLGSVPMSKDVALTR